MATISLVSRGLHEEDASSALDVDKNAALGFALVACAGAATGIGAAAVFFRRFVELASKKVLAAGIGVSAGVMLYVSFVEIFQKSVGAFGDNGQSPQDAYLCATISFFAGIAIMKVLDVLVHALDTHGVHHGCADPDRGPEKVSVEDGGRSTSGAKNREAEDCEPSAVGPAAGEPGAKEREAAELHRKLHRMGLNTALAIALHNFPEGLATFVATVADPAVGVTLAVAIAIHNVPEGLCVALPIFYARGSRWQAFLWGILSGVSEPLGALAGYIILKASGDDMNQIIYGVLFGIVAGMMVAIVLIELLPTAHRYDPTDQVVNYSVVAGMMVMAASLVMFLY